MYISNVDLDFYVICIFQLGKFHLERTKYVEESHSGEMGDFPVYRCGFTGCLSGLRNPGILPISDNHDACCLDFVDNLDLLLQGMFLFHRSYKNRLFQFILYTSIALVAIIVYADVVFPWAIRKFGDIFSRTELNDEL